MKYLIYAAIAVAILWAVWYLVRHVHRQLKGDCRCGGGKACGENCSGCGGCGK